MVNPTIDLPLTQAMAYDASGFIIYLGKAAPGTATTATGWQIQKFTYSGTNVTKIEWAGGSPNFDKVWDDRSSYSYS
jgi:hypothetical protein